MTKELVDGTRALRQEQPEKERSTPAVSRALLSLVLLVAVWVVACSDDRSTAVVDRLPPSDSTAVTTETATPEPALDSPTSVVASGVVTLINTFIKEVDPAEVFRDAWDGATIALRNAGVTEIPPSPNFAHATTEAATQHRQAFPALERLAAGRLSPHDLTTAALREAAARRQDCHTEYIPAKEVQAARAYRTGQQPPRVGIRLGSSTPPQIEDVFPGSPGDRAGLHPGQRILAINGRLVDALSGTEAVAIVRDQGQAPLTLRLQEPDGRLGEVTVTADILPLVGHMVLPGGVGLVRFDSFPPGTQLRDQLHAAFQDLEAQGVQGWVLDLRFNGGGQARALEDIAGLFTEHPRVYGTLSRRDTAPAWRGTQGEPLAVQHPLVVLIGPSTLSAAEHLAGFLQGAGRATLVGQTTAGCIGVERFVNLADGSQIGVTEYALLVGPDGRQLNRAGIAPDLPVPAADRSGGADPVLDAALWVLHEQ